MHKTLLKLATAGALITSLLAVAMITQGCQRAVDPTPQATQSTKTNKTETQEVLVPDEYIFVDETGIHIQLPTQEQVAATEESTAATLPAETIPAEKPSLGQVIVEFFENIFGLNKDEPATTDPSVAQGAEDTTKPQSAQTENVSQSTDAETAPQSTQSTQSTQSDDGKMTYQDYLDMNDDQRAAFQLSFAEDRFTSIMLFTDWLKEARAAHTEEEIVVTVGPDGNINLDDLVK